MNDTVKTAVAYADAHAAAARASGFTVFDRFLRGRLIAQLAPLRFGRLVLQDACGRVEMGDASAREIHVEVTDPRFYQAVAANGSVGSGEAWIEGYWRCSDLVGLIQLLVRNRELLDGMETGLARFAGLLMRAGYALARNTRRGSRRNIAAHYDLGNAFFELFLSPDLMYSSAIWDGEQDSLQNASTRKLDRICQTLELGPHDHVIEVGTGWGGFALHAARHYGCHVTTTTISQEQYRLACDRVSAAGMDGRITVLLQDYRDLQGTFDAFVSIEMIEAVGARYLDTYFGKVAQLLRPGGRALIQAITIEDHRYEQALRSVDYIKRYVFPGSFIPSIQAMLTAKSRVSDLALVQLTDFGESYARTLRAWRERFLARLPEVRAQGFDDRFIRLWEFYLAYCEGGFRERSIGVSQLHFRKPGVPS